MVGLIVLAGMLALPAAAEAQEAPAQLTVRSVSPKTFSPNGDRQDDTTAIDFCLSAAANVTAELRDEGGQLVRVAASGVSYPSGCSSLTWDGRDDGGALVPDGTYIVGLTAVNASGAPTSDSVEVAVDRRLPGSLTSPAAGSTVSGTTTFEFTPADGMNVTGVQFGFIDRVVFQIPCGFTLPSGVQGQDGVFRAQLDSTTCPHGTQVPASAWVTYLDRFGESHSWISPTNVVTVDNPVPELPPEVAVSASPRTIGPATPGVPSTLPISYCVADSDANGLLAVLVRVLSPDGDVVRTLVDESQPPSGSSCSSNQRSVSWDGLDDDGDAAPDGAYVVEVTATDPTELSDTATVDVAVDRRLPGSLTSPAAGSTVSGTTTFEFTPADGMNVTGVQFGFIDPVVFQIPCGFTLPSGVQGQDGVFRVQLDSTTCPHGMQVPASAWVTYLDGFGESHTWFSPTNVVTVDNPVPELPPEVVVSASPRTIGPATPGVPSTLPISYCVADSDADGLLAVLVRVLGSDSEVVRTLVDESQPPTGSSCSSNQRSVSWDGLDDDGDAVPDGAYVVEVTATDPTELSDTAAVEVAVDRRLPGSLTSPTAGSTVSGMTTFEFTPLAGMNVTGVHFGLFPCAWLTPGVADNEGAFRGELDTTSCPDQSVASTGAMVTYLDGFGEPLSWFSPPTPVTVDNPRPPEVSVSASPRVFAPHTDGTGPTTSVTYCASDTDPTGDLAVTVRVLDQAGEQVRSLLDEVATPSSSCRSVSWNGLNDDGFSVEDGSYRLEVGATDPTDRSDVATFDIAVDRRGAGMLITPSAGSTLSGAAPFEFRPTDGTVINSVNLILTDPGFTFFHQFTIHNASPDGIWRTTLPVGQFRAGPVLVGWSASYRNSFGEDVTTDFVTFEAAIDPTGLPLNVDVHPASGSAPLDATFEVTTSDPNNQPLRVAIDFGDGTGPHSQQLAAPYGTVEVHHTYQRPGTYQALVSVSNANGGYSSQIVPLAASGTPNTPPRVAISTSPAVGSAPLDTTTTIEATDADGDDLTYRIDFGDGSATKSGPLPVDAVEHRYAAPGTYLVRTEVNDGTVGIVRMARINVALDEELSAKAGDDQVVSVGDDVRFDASASRPSAVITAYEWNFGDGSTATGPNPRHTYARPGTYSVSLTVRSGSVTARDQAEVVIRPAPVVPGLLTTVRAGSGLVSGADVLVVQADGTRISGVTGADGAVRLHGLPDGEVTVYVYAPGLQPAVRQATIADGGGALDVALSSGAIGATEVKSRPLDYQEIVDLGIKIDNPENQHVYEYEIHLAFEPAAGDPQPSTPTLEIPILIPSRNLEAPLYVDTGQGYQPFAPGSAISWGENAVVPQVHYVDDQPIVQWLVIPGRARWLKEFFEVRMIVQNLAPEGFAFEEGTATLALPDGLTLAPTDQPQSLAAELDNIPGGTSSTTTWIVRGDVEGEYDLSAAYTGVLEPIGRSVRLEATSANRLKVWGASALEATIDTDDVAYSAHPYEVRVALKNVSDRPVYNLAIEAIDEGRENYILQPRERATQTVAELAPGESHVATYLLVPTISGDLDLSKSFVVRTGGDVDLKPEIVSHAPAQDPSTAPKIKTFRYPNKVVLQWDEVPDATSYGIFRTPQPDANFGPEPEHVEMVPEWERTGWVPVAEGENPYWAVSPIVGGIPWMRHPMMQSSAEQEYPRATSTRECGPTTTSDSGSHSVSASFEDPIFELASYEVLLDGERIEGGTLSGHTAEVQLRDLRKDKFDLKGSKLSITVTNALGDTSQANLTTLRSVCVRYAALGDSFSSGEGAFDYAPSSVAPEWRSLIAVGGVPIPVSVTAADQNRCHRSIHAYGPLLLDWYGEDYEVTQQSSDSFLFAACSGAKTKDIVSSAQYPHDPNALGNEKQIDHLREFVDKAGVDLVTLSIGGNDFNFSGIISSCLVDLTSCASSVGQRRILEQVNGASNDLNDTLGQVKFEAKGAPVYVLGYPSTIDSELGECSLTGSALLSQGERRFAEKTLIPYMNLVVKQASEAAGAVFVDVEDVMVENGTSHKLCSDHPWVNGFTVLGPSLTWQLGPVGIGTWLGTASFHPNKEGQRAMFERLRSTIEAGTKPSSSHVTVPTPATILGQASQLAVVTASTPGGSSFVDAGVLEGRSLTMSATGFAPGSTVTFTARSEPVQLGEVVVGLDGEAHLSTVLPPEIGPGVHSVELVGTAPSGEERIGGVTVLLLSQRPVAIDDVVSVQPNTTVTVDVLANDVDADGDALVAELVTYPTRGTVAFTESGAVEYRAPGGPCATDSFSYVAWDGQQASEPATVTLRCSQPLPTVLPGGGTVVEGDPDSPNLTMTVRLSHASAEVVTVPWRTLPQTGTLPPGTPGEDFEPVMGTVTFEPGQVEATVAVPIIDDQEVEQTEHLAVSFHDATNARIGGFYGIGFGIIRDDDTPVVHPGVTLTPEGGDPAVARLEVRLSKPSPVEARVDWSTLNPAGVPAGFASSGSDFEATSGTLIFEPGQTVAVIKVPLIDDATVEPDELIVVGFASLKNAVLAGGWDGLGWIGIIDNDGP